MQGYNPFCILINLPLLMLIPSFAHTPWPPPNLLPTAQPSAHNLCLFPPTLAQRRQKTQSLKTPEASAPRPSFCAACIPTKPLCQDNSPRPPGQLQTQSSYTAVSAWNSDCESGCACFYCMVTRCCAGWCRPPLTFRLLEADLLSNDL